MQVLELNQGLKLIVEPLKKENNMDLTQEGVKAPQDFNLVVICKEKQAYIRDIQ